MYIVIINIFFTYSSVCSVQCGFSSRSEMCFTPESPSLFPLRFSSIRCEGFDLRAEVRAAQPSFVILLLLSLWRAERGNLGFLKYKYLITSSFGVWPHFVLFWHTFNLVLVYNTNNGLVPTCMVACSVAHPQA